MAARKKEDAKRILERVENSPKDKAYYENAISQAIREFYYINYNAETPEQIAKCSQNTFIAACTYARRQCINREDLLCVVEHRVNSGSVVQNEAYDREVVEQLAEIYLNVCFVLDKLPSLYSFGELTGIDPVTLNGWTSENVNRVTSSYRRLSPKRAIEKIRDARTESLIGLATTGGKPTIGAVAVLNNSAWKEREQKREEERPLLASDLPDLSHLLPQNERQALPDFSKE